MDFSLDPIVYFIGSGLAFGVGALCVLAGVVASVFSQQRALLLLRNLAVLLGALFVGASAAPLEWWLYGLLTAATFIWLPLEWCRKSFNTRTISLARLGVLGAWILALGLELPYHLTPMLPMLGKPTLYLIGDSVSAGMVEKDPNTWPARFARQHEVEVRDLSKMGATAKSGRQQALGVTGDGLVLLEIGGNDLLNNAPDVERFAEELDLLLAQVCGPGRTVVMLALPLPPLANRFGLAQRRLAAKHDVVLIPQHVLVGVLTSPGATIDGIHLTPRGHQLMADTIWEVLAPAYGG